MDGFCDQCPECISDLLRARLVLLCILLVSQRLPLFTSMQHLQHRLRGPPTNPNHVVVRAPRAQSLRCRAAAAPADTASSTASALQSDIIRLSGSKYGHDLSAETRGLVSVVDRRYSICEAAVGGVYGSDQLVCGLTWCNSLILHRPDALAVVVQPGDLLVSLAVNPCCHSVAYCHTCMHACIGTVLRCACDAAGTACWSCNHSMSLCWP